MNIRLNERNVGAYYYNGYSHELQQPAAFLIVFAGYFDRSSREAFHIFCCAYGIYELQSRDE